MPPSHLDLGITNDRPSNPSSPKPSQEQHYASQEWVAQAMHRDLRRSAYEAEGHGSHFDNPFQLHLVALERFKATHGDLYAWAQARRHEAQSGVCSPAEHARLADAGVLEESPPPERQRN